MARWRWHWRQGHPYGSVKGRWIAIAACEDCGCIIIDHAWMGTWNRQTWGTYDAALARERGREAYLWYRVCEACYKRRERRERQRKRDAFMAEAIRNCVVCGDPFYLYHSRGQTREKWPKAHEIACKRLRCKNAAQAAFSTANYRSVKPRKLYQEVYWTVYRGDWRRANTIYLQCALLAASRESKGRNRKADPGVPRRTHRKGHRRRGNARPENGNLAGPA